MDVDTRPSQDLTGTRFPSSQSEETQPTTFTAETPEPTYTPAGTETAGTTLQPEHEQREGKGRRFRRHSYQRGWVRRGPEAGEFTIGREKVDVRRVEGGDLLRGVTGVSTGLALGFVLEKSKLYLPYIIREQALLHNFTIIKMFLAAVISGTLAVSLIDALSTSRERRERRGSVTQQAAKAAALATPSKGEVKSALFKNYDGNVVGGILLGIGIALSGSLPGAVFLQIGAGVDKSLWVLAGAFLGIFVYGSLERQGYHFGQRHGTTTNTTGGKGFQVSAGSAMLIAGTLSFFLYFLEKWYPWQFDIAPVLKGVKASALPPVGYGTYSLTDPAWSPIEAGLVAGLLQVPVFLWSRNALTGKASQYLSSLSFFIYGIDPRANVGTAFFEREQRKSESSDFWNVAFVIGILFGAYVSNMLSGNVSILTNPVTRPEAFLGGLLLLLGARIASQSAQSHMNSNFMEISLATLFTVLPMFGSAMVTAHLLW